MRLSNFMRMTLPPSPSTDSTTTCASCGASASGHYCANCGSPLSGAKCASCGTDLSPGAKFCHRCGAAAGSASPVRETRTNSLPWIVAALAFLALFAMAAGRGFNARPSSTVDGSQNALPQAGLDDRPSVGAEDAGSGVRAPDISSLSSQERADRLYNR